jgi:hypothetical protein
MDFSSCGLHARRAIWCSHLTHLAVLRAHAALRRMGAWQIKWLLLAAAVALLATHPMRADATGDCRDRALRGDRALNIYRTVH